MDRHSRSGEAEAVVIIKAAPVVGHKHGETVCCAGIDLEGNWLRLYPISFRSLEDGQKFKRWDRIRFKWRKPKDDQRVESRRVNPDTLKIVGKLKESERERFLAQRIVSSLSKERADGRSLALLNAEIIGFSAERKSDEEIADQAAEFARIRAQPDMFNTQQLIPYKPCPYWFKYRYRTDDGERHGKCQDWEIETTYFKWSKLYGCKEALAKIQQVFGEEYPEKGMRLAIGTHSRYPDTWLINGVVRLNEIKQPSLF